MSPRKHRLNIVLPAQLLARAKAAVRADSGLTLASLVRDALSHQLAALERRRGAAFRPFLGALPAGRPTLDKSRRRRLSRANRR